MLATIDAPQKWMAAEPRLPAQLLVTTTPAGAQLEVKWNVPAECSLLSADSTTDQSGSAEATVACPTGVRTVDGQVGDARFSTAIEFFRWSWHAAMEGIPLGEPIVDVREDLLAVDRLYAISRIRRSPAAAGPIMFVP